MYHRKILMNNTSWDTASHWPSPEGESEWFTEWGELPQPRYWRGGEWLRRWRTTTKVNSTKQDLKVRKAPVWRALNGITKIWNANLPWQIKLSFFYTVVQSVLFHSSECWSQKPTRQKSRGGCYTVMPQTVLKRTHITNRILYEGNPRVSQKIAARRMRLAGHCQWHGQLTASKLVLWELTHGYWSRGHPTLAYMDVFRGDAGAQSTSDSLYVWRIGMTGSNDGDTVSDLKRS